MSATNRAILHLDLDTFFVSCERLIDSRLIGRPILIGGTSDRGVVASCSYEARKFGVYSSMPMKIARQICPEAVVIRGNTNTYTDYSSMVTQIISESVPVYEKASIDEFYADLTGMDKFFGCFNFATELRKKIVKETGLPISFGLSQNKTVSKIATGIAKPNNQIRVDYGEEKQFLSPLSIKKIPMVGQKTYSTLSNLGLKRISDVQNVTIEFMSDLLGKPGRSIWKKANGIDTKLVKQYNERKSISTERTFEKDTVDVDKLKSILLAMAENLAFQLRRGGILTSCVMVKIRYSDFNTYTQQIKIPYTSSDKTIIELTQNLFDNLYNRRNKVRLIGIRLSHLVGGGHQIAIFQDESRMVQLYSVMDALRKKFGDRSIMRAGGMNAKTIGRYNPFNGEPPPLLANRKL